MSFIEGIGDEVTLFFVVVLVFFLAAAITLIGNSPSLSSTRTRQRWRGPPELGNESIYVMLFLLREVGFRTAIQRQRLSSSMHSPNSGAINELANDDQLINADDTLNSSSDNQHINTDDALNNSSDNEHINNDETLNNSSDNQTFINDAVRNFETDAEISSSNVEDDSILAHENVELHDSESAQASSVEENVTTEEFEFPRRQDEIRVRLKYLDDTEKTVTTSLNTNIGDFKKKHFQEDLRSNKIVRLIFAGHLLNNNSTIQHCRILDNSVVHVQILPAPTTQSVPIVNQETELELSWAFWPILTVILSLCWLTYFRYPEFYNSLSLGILLLFSGCYFYFLSRIRH